LSNRNQKKGFLEELNIAVKNLKVAGEREFVVIVPSFNNEVYVERNLTSILSQEYDNYRVIYIDDASTDTTYEKVKELVADKSNVELIRNEINLGALHNLYHAIHSCSDEEIVLTVDGDDWLAHSKVLQELNKYYANHDVWLTYGQYLHYPSNTPGICAPIEKKILKQGLVRAIKWQYSHLKTFYASLFKKIRKEDLTAEGEFFHVASDLAMMFPMLEMAREHAYFIPDILYIYNYENPLSDIRTKLFQQVNVDRYIRTLPVYESIPSLKRKKFTADSTLGKL